VHFTADVELRDWIVRARALASHRVPKGDLASLMKRRSRLSCSRRKSDASQSETSRASRWSGASRARRGQSEAGRTRQWSGTSSKAQRATRSPRARRPAKPERERLAAMTRHPLRQAELGLNVNRSAVRSVALGWAKEVGTLRLLSGVRSICEIMADVRSCPRLDGAARRGLFSSLITLSRGRPWAPRGLKTSGFVVAHTMVCMLGTALVPCTLRPRSRLGGSEQSCNLRV
jgi:hypothetical protein